MGHVLRGFIAKAATDGMEDHHRRGNKDRKTCTGILWGAKLIAHQWSKVHELWRTRCKELHGDKESHFSRRERGELVIKVSALYHQKDNVNNITRQLFNIPVEERIKQSSNKELKKWIAVVTPTIKEAIAEAKEHQQKKQTDIRDFLVFLETLGKENETEGNETTEA